MTRHRDATMNTPGVLLLLSAIGLVGGAGRASADEAPSFDAIAGDYEGAIRPLLKRVCLKCHSTDVQEGELDLERFTNLDQLRKAPRVWLKVIEMLDNGEMPPKKSEQPTDAERAKIRDWARRFLDAEGRANAGDPGSVVLRRLNNVEYDNTVRDLTGVDLRPAREFPVDGAAGEGFTNVGEALAMSPALLDKYVASAKGIAAHAVLLPDGFRFSDKTTRRDWTDEIVNQIRLLYRRHTDPNGGSRVNLQGLVWDTNSGGRIPLESYLNATLKLRDAKPGANVSVATIAAETQLSPKYLQIVWDLLHAGGPSPLLDQIRGRWRNAGPGDVAALAEEIRRWQTALTKFNSVAHFKPWMEPVQPFAESQAIRLKFDPKADDDVVIHLDARQVAVTTDLVEWQAPRLEAPGRPPILLRDVRDGLRGLDAKRKTLNSLARYLAAADDARGRTSDTQLAALAKERQLDPRMLAAWCNYLGIRNASPLKIEGVFASTIESSGEKTWVKGWGSPDTPNVVANSSDQEAHVPGTVKPHGVAVHPAPTQNVAVGWRSPMSGPVRVEARVAHAHPACGNGISWSLELRRGGERRRFSGGEIGVGQPASIDPIDRLTIQPGDLISVIIGPRGTDHSCDLTEVELSIRELGGDRAWTLSRDVSGHLLSANPHADSLGNPGVWYFYAEKATPETSAAALASIPRGSLLDRWREEPDRPDRDEIAARLQNLVTSGAAIPKESPDAILIRQLTSFSGPLLGRIDFRDLVNESADHEPDPTVARYGIPLDQFGKHPTGGVIDPSSLLVRAPSTIEIRLPAELLAGREFVTSARLDRHEGRDGTAQAQVVVGPVPAGKGLVPGVPILVQNDSESRNRLERDVAEFRRVFPAALCYPQIVPVDEVVTLVLFHREDEALSRLILDESEHRRLDRLWDELRYVSQDAIKVKEAYGQFMEYVTQDGDVRIFEPLRKPITERAEALKKRLIDTEPRHLDRLAEFASTAYRRPLAPEEAAGLRTLYAALRKQGLEHDDAFRLTLARVLMAPSFLYHVEQPASSDDAKPVSDWELANRLSYFLWSTMPDAELRKLAADGTLHQPGILGAQVKRMLRDPRARALATEFACQWIDIRGFDTHDEKSEQVFPEFAALRPLMYEESVRFFVDLFGRDGSLLEVLDADHTFVNGDLAKFYGIPGVQGPDWRRVDGVKKYGRGGVLGMASLLAKQSGASRTSPILRGNWLSEMLLGEKLPKPPKNVPQLPESELDTNGLTLRQITEKHRAVASCAKCHDKIDPFGFALEGFDAIGRRRTKDLAGRPIDTHAELKDGTQFDDIDGLRTYLLAKRRGEIVRHFCRKLLGYAVNRSVQLSDDPLINEMAGRVLRDDPSIQTAILAIVHSPQFRLRRGLDSPLDRDDSHP